MENSEEDLNVWVGKEAFGLGCSISVILSKYGVARKEECLLELLIRIREWSKHFSSKN